MSEYITSVQIRDGEESDYKKLDAEMEKGSFVRMIKSGVGMQRVVDPSREYRYRGLVGLPTVIIRAYAAASRVGKHYLLKVEKNQVAG